MSGALHFLCAGAAQGLVRALQPRFEADTGLVLQGRFGAVGAMKDALLGGEPCDLLVLTDALVRDLTRQGRLRGDSISSLGRVRTAVAVRRGQTPPDVSTPEALRAALLAADAIYFPDPERATAGIHFANVMRELAVHDALRPLFRTFPSGAIAMRELADSTTARPIGCTQVTEILYTEGVQRVALLPQRFELATVYTGAVTSVSTQAAAAAQLLARLVGDESRALRGAGGFE